MGPLRDPKPVYNQGESLVTLKRMITKTASSINEILLTVGDLYNLFNGNFIFKITKVDCWVLNTDCTANFQFKRAAYSDTLDDSDVSVSDVGNGRNFPAVSFKVPPILQKEIQPSSGNTTQIVFCKLGGVPPPSTDACFQVTILIRL